MNNLIDLELNIESSVYLYSPCTILIKKFNKTYLPQGKEGLESFAIYITKKLNDLGYNGFLAEYFLGSFEFKYSFQEV